MTRSENKSLVLRKTSFTIRERLIPEIACSTPTLTREIFLLFRFSVLVNSPLRGFFWVAECLQPEVRTPESPYPYKE